MSERPDGATVETEPREGLDASEQDEGHEADQEEGEEGEEGEGERKPVDWEKKFHDKAGQAAAERSKRRATERNFSDLQSRFEALESKVNGTQRDELTELIESLRDDDDEPITDINQIKRVLKTFMQQQVADAKAEGDRQGRVRQVNVLMQTMDAYEKDFADDQPDYFKAADYVREQRREELADQGYSGRRLEEMLANELFGMTRDMIASGRDPAEAVFKLALRRGFKAGEKTTDAKLRKIAAGAQAAQGTQQARSRGSDNGLSWDAVAKLKGAARDAAFAKLRNRELGRS